MTCFADTNELLRFAKTFLAARVDSLQKDVLHCLQEPPAPFPALLYSFATVDLLGALLEGKPSWLERLEREVIYLSPVELATRAAEHGASNLATALRTLPILWRNYELLPHYSQGLSPRASS